MHLRRWLIAGCLLFALPAATLQSAPERKPTRTKRTARKPASEPPSAGAGSPSRKRKAVVPRSPSKGRAGKAAAATPGKPGTTRQPIKAGSAPPTAAKPATATRPKVPAAPPGAAPKPAGPLAAADRFFADQSYARALAGYRAAVNTKSVPSSRSAEVAFRIAHCLGETSQWDSAIAAMARLAQEQPRTVWAARAHASMSRLLADAPKQGWRVGPRLIRGEEIPDVPTGEIPISATFAEEDLRQSREAAEAARRAWDALAEDDRYRAESAQFHGQLAAAVLAQEVGPWVRQRLRTPAEQVSWKIDVAEPFDPGWPAPRRAFWLFKKTEVLAAGQAFQAARLRTILARRTYAESVASLLEEARAEGRSVDVTGLPYQKPPWQELLVAFSHDRAVQSDDLRLSACRSLAESEDPGLAIKPLERFLEERPGSRLAPAASRLRAQVLRVWLAVDSPEPQLPGRKARLRVHARNAGEVRFTARRLRLEEAVRSTRVLASAGELPGDILRRLGGAKGAAEWANGDPISWREKLSEPADRRAISREVETPLTRTGAYLVEADTEKVSTALLVLISDLAVVRVTGSSRVLAFVVNARTGAPVVDAQVVFREVYRDRESKARSNAGRVSTDADGLAGRTLASDRVVTESVFAFAWKGDRYAWGSQSLYSQPPAAMPADRVWLTTDRPIYRPGQSVRFRALMVQPTGQGSWSPAPGRKLRIELRDARDAVAAQVGVETGEYGSASGALALSPSIALGEARLVATWQAEGKPPVVGGVSIALEAYRRPEFEVTLEGGGRAVRDGAAGTIAATARYFHGAPVVGARARYSITRTAAHLSRRQWSSEGLPPPLTVTGTAATDAAGRVVLHYPAWPTPPPTRPVNFNYHVEVSVIDASRRTETLQRLLAGSSSDYRAVVGVDTNWSRIGQLHRIRVTTTDLQGKGRSAQGSLRVMRAAFPDGESGEPVLAEVARLPVVTDASGGAVIDWPVTADGRLIARFEGRDAGARPVLAEAEFWVVGEAAASGVRPEDGLQVIPQHASASRTRRVPVLLVSRRGEASVLLVATSGGRILERRVVRLTGRTGVVEVETPDADVRSLSLIACMVHEGRGYSATAESPVDAVGRGLQLRLTADKPRYQPGEKARWLLDARSAEGRPVRGEFSLSVYDASLLALAGDSTSPLRDLTAPAGDEGWCSVDVETAQTAAGVSTDRQPPLPEPEANSALITAPTAGATSGPTTGMLGGLPARVSKPMDAGPGGKSFESDGRTDAQNRTRRPAPPLRTRMDETAFWSAAVVTDANGRAELTFDFPDSLTRWVAVARGLTLDARVGEAESQVETYKDLIVRLQAPRFLIERDQVVASAIVHNNSDTPRLVDLRLEALGGVALETSDSGPRARELTVPRADQPGGGLSIADRESAAGPINRRESFMLPSHGERRVDWRLRVIRSGELRLRAVADAGAEATDGVEIRVPLVMHGVEKQVSRAGALPQRDEQGSARAVKLNFDLPAERTPGGELVVSLQPSLMGTVLRALPGLIDYPYGCTEQTLNRFVPAVVVLQTLRELGVDLKALAATGASGPPGERVVTDAAELQRVVDLGMERLRRFQLSDGSWGWWEGDSGSLRMTSLVAQGLTAAKSAGVSVPPDMLERAFAYLVRQSARVNASLRDRIYAAAALLADAKRGKAAGDLLAADVFPRREVLTPYSLALLAVVLRRSGHPDESRICLENLENTARVDAAAGLCFWPREGGGWYDNHVEQTAVCLQAYVTIDPKHRLAPMIARWLAAQNTGGAWRTTRESALVIQSLLAYARATQELAPDMTVTVEAAGARRQVRLSGPAALIGGGIVRLPLAGVSPGPMPVTVSREGKGMLYYTAYVRFTTLEEGVAGAGQELRITRRFFRLPTGTPTPDPTAARRPLRPGEAIASGEQIECELVLESRTDLEYVLVEDFKPAGCEPVDVRSGARFGDGLCSNVELRDDRVAFFMTQLPAGRRILRYRVRAEAPGVFHAMPARGGPMYAPAIRALSDEGIVRIEEATPAMASTP